MLQSAQLSATSKIPGWAHGTRCGGRTHADALREQDQQIKKDIVHTLAPKATEEDVNESFAANGGLCLATIDRVQPHRFRRYQRDDAREAGYC